MYAHMLLLLNLYTTVCRHFDLNELWTQDRVFSVGIFVTLVQTMQVGFTSTCSVAFAFMVIIFCLSFVEARLL